MRLQTIVALTDFSTAAEHALDRAALLAAEHKARLHLLFGAEQPNPKFVDPQARLEQRARQLARRHDLPVKALAYRGVGVVDEVLRAAVGADLLVLDKRAHQGVEQLWRGGTLSQILRRSPCPVLVVQRAAREAYAHVLLAVDLSPAADAMVRYASGLDTAAAVELFHSVDLRDEAKLRSAEASAQAVRAWRAQMQRHAHDRLVRLSDAFEARRNRVGMTVGMGDVARQVAVQQERSGAELVALTHRRRGWMLDLLLGSVAQRLLGGVGCDVLVYPHDYAGAAPRGTTAQPRVARRWTQAI